MPRGDPDLKTFSYTPVMVLRYCKGPADLCQVTMHPDQTIFLVRGQVQTHLAPANCGASLFLRVMNRVPHASHFRAKLPMMLKLKAQHAVKPQASHAQLLSLSTCKKALTALGVEPITLASLQALVPVPQHQQQLLPALVTSSQPQAITRPQMQLLPDILPTMQYTEKQLQQRYGLKLNFATQKLLKLEPLQSQIVDLHLWMTTPINMARAGQKYISQATWDKGFHQIICTYLGFCHLFMAVAQPSLEHFLDPHMFAAYTDFIMQRVSPPVSASVLHSLM